MLTRRRRRRTGRVSPEPRNGMTLADLSELASQVRKGMQVLSACAYNDVLGAWVWLKCRRGACPVVEQMQEEEEVEDIPTTVEGSLGSEGQPEEGRSPFGSQRRSPSQSTPCMTGVRVPSGRGRDSHESLTSPTASPGT